MHLSEMFGKHKTLIVYNYMYGPQRKRPCPMCTSLLSSWDGEAPDVEQRAALAVVAKSPIKRLSNSSGSAAGAISSCTRPQATASTATTFAEGPQGEDDPAFNVFIKRNGKIRHFWGGEMTMEMARSRPGSRGARRI